MAVFPQLATGGSALYPVIRKTRARTVLNAADDGGAVKYADPDGGVREWELRGSGLSRDEWEAVEALFALVRGRLDVFTFLDPVGNLLARSEEFADPVWTNGALIVLTPGVADPFGTTRATHVVNGGAAVAGVAQTLAAPTGYQYSLSVWARSAGGASVTLRAGSAARQVVLGGSWKRYSITGGGATFGVDLPAAVAVDLFGMQVEAQVGVSDYKKTGARGGVYRARFSGDLLVGRAVAEDVYEGVVKVVAV